MLKNKQVLYLIAFSSYPVLFLYSNNYTSAFFIQIFSPILIAYTILGIGILLLAAFNIKFKLSSDISFLILVVFMSFFLYYGHLHYSLYNLDLAYVTVGNDVINLGRNRYLLPLLLIICSAFIVIVIKLSATKKITGFISFLTMILCFQQGVIIAYKSIKSHFNTAPLSNVEFNQQSPNPDNPDIYFIILDAYASSYTLSQSFRYNNWTLSNFLTKKGFKMPENSHSNYPFTKFSLTSTLNFEHLNSSKYKYDENLFYYLKNNKLSNYLKAHGYNYYYFDTGYGYKKPEKNDFVISQSLSTENSSDNDFFSLFLNTTLFSIQINDLSQIKHKEFRQKINYAFDQLPKIASNGKLKFVFLHLSSPHPPYIFKEDGSDQKYVPEKSGFAKTAYLEQLKYITKKTQLAIEGILKNSPKEPIIILQSDHGVSFDFGAQTDSRVLKDRFLILNAIYAPTDLKKKFYPGITSVNTFRIILNEIFNEKMPLLNDKSYMTSQSPPFRYIDITDSLKANSK